MNNFTILNYVYETFSSGLFPVRIISKGYGCHESLSFIKALWYLHRKQLFPVPAFSKCVHKGAHDFISDIVLACVQLSPVATDLAWITIRNSCQIRNRLLCLGICCKRIFSNDTFSYTYTDSLLDDPYM